jgi:hypothetical protein
MVTRFQVSKGVLHSSTGSGLLSGIKIPGYPTDGKIWHPVRSLKPYRSAPRKTDLLRALTTCQSLEACTTNSIPPEPCGKVSGEIRRLGQYFFASPEPP